MSLFRRKAFFWSILALASVLLLGYGGYRGLTDFETAENVEHVDWLPDAAHNISYYRSYSFTAYEFDISEDEFLRWTEDQGWKAEKVQSPVDILRYSTMTAKFPGDHSSNLESERSAEFEQWERLTRKTITDGYYYDYRQRNGGGVTVGYDLTSGRAYCQTSPR